MYICVCIPPEMWGTRKHNICWFNFLRGVSLPTFFSGGAQNRIQCFPLNWITLGRIKSDNINQMIQLTEDTISTSQKAQQQTFKIDCFLSMCGIIIQI